MMHDGRVRVLIVDDHAVVRTGLRTVISLHDGVEVVGEAVNGREAVELCGESLPDVVLMDMKMPVVDGPTAIARIRSQYPGVNIVALTSFDDDTLARRALEAGAIGYLMKDASEEDLITAIRLAADGRGVVAPSAMNALIAGASEDEHPGYRPALTDREEEVLRLVARGLTNPQIANRLVISVSTVNFHVHNLLDKLGAKTRTEAVSIAVREGLVEH
jgi:NarL family two-component system response regulator LiaR